MNEYNYSFLYRKNERKIFELQCTYNSNENKNKTIKYLRNIYIIVFPDAKHLYKCFIPSLTFSFPHFIRLEGKLDCKILVSKILFFLFRCISNDYTITIALYGYKNSIENFVYCLLRQP